MIGIYIALFTLFLTVLVESVIIVSDYAQICQMRKEIEAEKIKRARLKGAIDAEIRKHNRKTMPVNMTEITADEECGNEF